MCKIQRLYETTLELNFLSRQSELALHRSYFLGSDLGKIYRAIPWEELVRTFGLKESILGRKSHFSPSGKLALMFLKNYTSLSDEKLVEQLNSNISYQLFCGVLIHPSEPLKNGKIVSSIRTELSALLSIELAQRVLAEHWEPYLKSTDQILTDATCYESSVRYPTDQKLIWESVSWAYDQLKWAHKELGQRMPRTKYLKWSGRYHNYARKRKTRIKQRRSLTGGLLRLLEKLLPLLEQCFEELGLELDQYPRLGTVKDVFEQQSAYFYLGIKPKNRIISLFKPYLRPIVRGKEVKRVEFGAKVNKLQVDGINFIEYLDFEAFHEGIRLDKTIWMSRRLFGKVSLIGADAIYATNDNRKFCSKRKIQTDFVRKGRAGKFEKQRKILAKAIKKERATRLEGSFGNEKNHYNLRTIKARTKKNEILWIFFGIHTANALNIGRRIDELELNKAA